MASGIPGVNLPEGWLIRPAAHGDHVLHVEWPDHGATSVDIKRRLFELGYCHPRKGMGGTYTGRGWRARLFNDAIDALKAAWDR